MAYHRDWSHWSLGDFQKCGIFFETRHIRGIRKQKPAAAIRGIALHAQAQETFRRRYTNQPILTPDEAKDCAADAFEKEWEKGHRLDKDELEEFDHNPKKVKAAYKDEAVSLSGEHARIIAPAVTPLAVERKYTVEPKGWDFRIHTVVDLVDAQTPITFNPEPDPDVIPDVVVRDLKSKRKPPGKNEAEQSQQLTFQALGLLADTQELPDSLQLDVMWTTAKRKDLKHRFDSTKRTEEHIAQLLQRIYLAHEAVNKGVFLPPPTDHWACSEKYCEFWFDCPFGAKGRVQSK